MNKSSERGGSESAFAPSSLEMSFCTLQEFHPSIGPRKVSLQPILCALN